MKLFDAKDNILEKFRKRGAIPEWYVNDNGTAEAVYIRADGWSCGGTVGQMKEMETGKHDWRYVWQPGEAGGDLLMFASYIGNRDEIQSSKDQQSNAEGRKVNNQQNDARGTEKSPYQRKKGLRDKKS